jgi:hypothetical protein
LNSFKNVGLWTQKQKWKVKKTISQLLTGEQSIDFLVEIKANVYIGIVFNIDRWAIPAALIDIVP